MQAKKVVVTRRGGPEVIEVVNDDVPSPKAGQVRIKVTHAGLSYADVMLRHVGMPGLPKVPFTPGADAVGVVDRIGDQVRRLKVGDRVGALLMDRLGGQAQYVCVDETRVHPVPEDVPLDTAACLLINYLTAYGMLSRVEELLPRPTTVLIHGGSGGVGSALIQIAVSKGMKVLSTASERNLAFLDELGASPIDYRKDDFAAMAASAGGVDAVFDPIGGEYLTRSLRVLKSGGCYVAYGFQGDWRSGIWGISKSMARFGLAKLANRGKRLTVFQLRDRRPAELRETLSELFRLYAERRIAPMISEVVPFDEARRAHGDLERGHRRGKILLAC